jgi:hypothetical protein
MPDSAYEKLMRTQEASHTAGQIHAFYLQFRLHTKVYPFTGILCPGSFRQKCVGTDTKTLFIMIIVGLSHNT